MPHDHPCGCGKLLFVTPQAAHRHKQSFRDKASRECLTAYRCPEGRGWHLSCYMRNGRKRNW